MNLYSDFQFIYLLLSPKLYYRKTKLATHFFITFISLKCRIKKNKSKQNKQTTEELILKYCKHGGTTATTLTQLS